MYKDNHMIQTQAKSNLPVYLLIGFLQGLVGYLGTTYWPDNNQVLQSLFLGLITGVAVTGLAFQLVLSNRLEKYVQMFAVGLGVLYASIAIWLIYQFPEKTQSNTWVSIIIASWMFSSVLLAYVLLPFIQSWPTRQNNHYNYSDLYEHSWDNFFIFLVAGLLAGVYWLLIVLLAMLFKMLGITLFVDLFFSAPFAWFTLPVFRESRDTYTCVVK
jgi:MFS family permease